MDAPVSYDNVPSALRAIPRWVCWRYVERVNRETGEVTNHKVPWNKDRRTVSALDPTNWMDFDTAVATSRKLGGGIGFTFNGDRHGVIDLDGCRDRNTGKVAPWAQEHLDEFAGAYTELSPSGRGFHIVTAGAPERLSRTERKYEATPGIDTGDKEPMLEAFVDRRYITITGEQASGDITDCAEQWTQVVKRLGASTAERSEPAEPLDIELDVVRDALATLSSDEVGRSLWIGFGQALKHQFGEEARSTWLEWMSRSPHDDADASERKWEELSTPDHITVRSILWHARQKGWQGSHDYEFDTEVASEWLSDPDELTEEDIDASKKPPRFKRYSIMELLDLPDPVWTVEGLILERSLAMIYGAPKSFKTFASLDLGLCIAMGIPYHRHAVVRGRVTYVAAEGNAGETRYRVLVWCREHDINPRDLDGWFSLVITGPHLDDEGQVKEFLREDPEPCDVTFIDTANRSMKGDESSTKDMTAFVRGCDKVRSRLKCAVIVIHHSGVDQGRERGSTVLRAAVDTRIRVSKDKGTVTMLVEDQRAGPDGEKMFFQPVTVPVRDIGGPDSVVLRSVASAVPDNGHQDKKPKKVATEDVMLQRIADEKPTKWGDLISSDITGFSRNNVNVLRAKLTAEKLVQLGDTPRLTPLGRERLKAARAERAEDTEE